MGIYPKFFKGEFKKNFFVSSYPVFNPHKFRIYKRFLIFMGIQKKFL